MTWTTESIARATPALPVLSTPVRGWLCVKGGGIGEEVTIPAGSKMIDGDASIFLQLRAMYGGNRSIATFVLADGTIVEHFVRIDDAVAALPRESPTVKWCTACQRYHDPPACQR